MDITDSLKRLVRGALGLNPDRKTPSMAHVAPYRARVVACAADGSTVDLQPDDSRPDLMQGVKVITGIPHFVAVIEPGSIVWIGWEGGDPSKPRAIPAWESATVSSMTIAGGTKAAVRVDDKVAADTSMATWLSTAQPILAAAAATYSLPVPVAPTDFGKASTGSPRVKIG